MDIVNLMLKLMRDLGRFYHAPFAANNEQRSVYQGHIAAYSEVLFQWQLNEKRAEMLKHLRHAQPQLVLKQLNGIEPDNQIGTMTVPLAMSTLTTA